MEKLIIYLIDKLLNKDLAKILYLEFNNSNLISKSNKIINNKI